ncbi:hypothetical protein FNW02_36645 [Komarekiella sp. 'clone 1']|uniref:Uncharacterized protein n=1 Tax=Komarekiella delphini-convector SJRDD-AB1 TaxID=2593771 RepID=A0AA40VVK7_9NOST|nr:hypothetical protein [Komarekiella delphini-convector]MBD6621097.1 hypothetical protein [Komarekiella delphini-convector SJRDD-AB1]
MYRVSIQVVNEYGGVIEKFPTHLVRVPCIGESIYLSICRCDIPDYQVLEVIHYTFAFDNSKGLIQNNDSKGLAVAEVKVKKLRPAR